MKNLYLCSLFFFAISIVFSSDINGGLNKNTDNEPLILSTKNDQDNVSKNIDSSIDIEKIKETRLAKGKVEKIKSQSILNKQKNVGMDKDKILNPNVELIGREIKAKQMLSQKMGADIFENFTNKIKKKYVMRSIGDSDSDRKIKFPIKTESK